MGFYLRRYVAALRAHKQWALLVPLALGVYLVAAALDDVSFSVSQELSSYSGDIPVAASSSPVLTVKLDQLVADPDLLYLDGFALMQLQKKLDLQGADGDLAGAGELRRVAHSALSLSRSGDSGLRLGYTGKDPTLGRALVAFYTDRLMQRVRQGVVRTASRPAPSPPALAPAGEVVVVGERSAWSDDRLLPATVVLLLSSLGVLVLIAVVELSDPSFKSERQIARYLGIPVLGALPNAEPLVRALPE